MFLNNIILNKFVTRRRQAARKLGSLEKRELVLGVGERYKYWLLGGGWGREGRGGGRERVDGV